MQKEIELKCLCDGLLNALRKMGLGKYSLRNYYYEGMWPLIKAYRKAGKELYEYVGRILHPAAAVFYSCGGEI